MGGNFQWEGDISMRRNFHLGGNFNEERNFNEEKKAWRCS